MFLWRRPTSYPLKSPITIHVWFNLEKGTDNLEQPSQQNVPEKLMLTLK